jgi:hypothetical protein
VNLFYVSLAAIVLGLGMLGFLAISNRREETPAPAAKQSVVTATKK